MVLSLTTFTSCPSFPLLTVHFTCSCAGQALIHLDRLLFVREGLGSGADAGGSGSGEAGLVPLFDASISPRNIALVAVRRGLS